MTPLERATARLWLTLPFVRRSRRMGISTRRMLVLYFLVNWWIVALITAALNIVCAGECLDWTVAAA